MRALRTIAIIPAAALLFVACGSDGNDTAGSAPDTTAATAADTTLAVEATTLPPADTTPADTTPVTAVDGPVQIDVLVGTDSGPDRVEKVKVGSAVTLNLTNPNAADEFHVHTIELEQAVDAGVTATFNFVVDTPGTYEVESHVTEEILVVIEVV
jgi:hypothetical protein